LGSEDLGGLCTLAELNWGVLNREVGRPLTALQIDLLREGGRNGELGHELERWRKEIGDLWSQVTQEQSEKAALTVENDERPGRLGKLERARTTREETIERQTSELDNLKVKQKNRKVN
jgi:hypothetical protein